MVCASPPALAPAEMSPALLPVAPRRCLAAHAILMRAPCGKERAVVSAGPVGGSRLPPKAHSNREVAVQRVRSGLCCLPRRVLNERAALLGHQADSLELAVRVEGIAAAIGEEGE